MKLKTDQITLLRMKKKSKKKVLITGSTGFIGFHLKKKLNSDSNFRFHFFLAEKLHKTIGEILQMPVEEFNMWVAYYNLKHEEEQKALNKAKMQGKRR